MGRWIYPRENTEFASKTQAASSYPPLSHVENYLKQAKQLIRRDRFIVLDGDPQDPTDTRCKKNGQFMYSYNLTSIKSQKSLLLSIDPEDFCHTVSTNDGRRLYVFCIERELQRHLHESETVAIYIKHDFDPSTSENDIVVSLHPIERPIYLPFQD